MENKKELLTKLFVAGIPKEASDDDLRNHFSTYGAITDCVAIKELVLLSNSVNPFSNHIGALLLMRPK